MSVANDGASALRIARTELPDVALLDIGLPGMDGYELAAQLKADAGLRRVQLIAMTGYGLDEDRRRSTAAGFAAHLTKPLSLRRVTEALASCAGASSRAP